MDELNGVTIDVVPEDEDFTPTPIPTTTLTPTPTQNTTPIKKRRNVSGVSIDNGSQSSTTSRKRGRPRSSSTVGSRGIPKTRVKTITSSYYLLCSGKGVIYATSKHEALEILHEEFQDGDNRMYEISLEQRFCYPVSFGEPEKVPVPSACGSKDLSLFICSGFDFVPGFNGKTMVVAKNVEDAIHLTNMYLQEQGLKMFDEKQFNVALVPKSIGIFDS